MSEMTPTEWETVVIEVLRWEYPLLPATLPAAVASLVPVWAERVAALDPTVRQEMLGSYQVMYSPTSEWLTAVEASLLRRYRRARTGSPVLGSPSSEASAERKEWLEETDRWWTV